MQGSQYSMMEKRDGIAVLEQLMIGKSFRKLQDVQLESIVTQRKKFSFGNLLQSLLLKALYKNLRKSQ